MSETISELKEKLKTLDEILLMELLEVTSEDLIEMFSDRIEEHQDKLKGTIE